MIDCTTMRSTPLMVVLILFAGHATAEELPKVPHGSIQRLNSFQSQFVDARNVDVWLPDGYGPGKRYDVLYMQDGQMLFDPSITWNKQSWDAAGILSQLIADGRVRPTIIVAIWNISKLRHSEYFPEKYLPLIPEPARTQFVDKFLTGKPRGDAYLRFIVQELKPYIDAHFQTYPEREHSFIMGSSMGGLISLYAICEYPQIFGGAAGLSTHWIGSFEPNSAIPLAAFNYLSGHLPSPGDHRLYMDHGTAGLDAMYGPAQTFIDQILRDRGYTSSDWSSQVFEGATHDEVNWSRRLAIPLQFLLAPAAAH
jgi:enterochelin esterase-like enzyme